MKMSIKSQSGYSDLDVLYAVYRKLYDFLEKMLDADVIEITPARNAQYLSFTNIVLDIVERPENASINCFLPVFESLYSDPLLCEEGDIEWKYTISPNMLASLERISAILAQKKISGVVTTQKLVEELKRATEASLPAFTVSFPNEQMVKVNDYVLSKPHFNSRNEQILFYLYKNPNRRITKDELQKEVKSEKNVGAKKIERALRDLGFEGVLLKAFFPHISINAVHFRNPVRVRDLSNAGISVKEIASFLETKASSRKK